MAYGIKEVDKWSRTMPDKRDLPSAEGNNLLNEERRRAILEMMQHDGRVLVVDLAKRFHTSQVTIRKDLEFSMFGA